MIYLLDVGPLIALLVKTHPHHTRVKTWQSNLDLAICPLTELGYLRIATQPILGFSVPDARKALETWIQNRKPQFVACDLPALEADPPPGSSKTTDFYLASLAAKNNMELATLDQNLKHKSAFLIPP